MGPVARAMLTTLAESPSAEAGFRKAEVAASAIRNGWVKYTWESGRITFYAITPQGREAIAATKGKRR